MPCRPMNKYSEIVKGSSGLRNISKPQLGKNGILVTKMSLFLITVLVSANFTAQKQLANCIDFFAFQETYRLLETVVYIIYALGLILIFIGYGWADVGNKRIIQFLVYAAIALLLPMTTEYVVDAAIRDSWAFAISLTVIALVWTAAEILATHMQKDFDNAEVVHMMDVKEAYYIKILLAASARHTKKSRWKRFFGKRK